MLIRKASAPTSARRRIIAGLSEAGPRVARILTLRLRGTNRLGVVLVGMGAAIAAPGRSSTREAALLDIEIVEHGAVAGVGVGADHAGGAGDDGGVGGK